MLPTMQGRYAFDGESIAADAFDAGTHCVEQVAQVLDVRLRGGVAYQCVAVCQGRSQDSLLGAGDACFVEEYFGAAQTARAHFVAVVMDVYGRAQLLQCEKMGICASTANSVA